MEKDVFNVYFSVVDMADGAYINVSVRQSTTKQRLKHTNVDMGLVALERGGIGSERVGEA